MMRKYVTVFVILVILIALGCSKDSTKNQDSKTIIIGDYQFSFASDYTLKEINGIDSYVGTISVNDVELIFDYGWYTSPFSIQSNDYEITVDTINGHYRQIVKGLQADYLTRMHLYDIEATQNSPYGYNSLTISSRTETNESQEEILQIFQNITIVD